jgi:hypothetical protein
VHALHLHRENRLQSLRSPLSCRRRDGESNVGARPFVNRVLEIPGTRREPFFGVTR